MAYNVARHIIGLNWASTGLWGSRWETTGSLEFGRILLDSRPRMA